MIFVLYKVRWLPSWRIIVGRAFTSLFYVVAAYMVLSILQLAAPAAHGGVVDIFSMVCVLFGLRISVDALLQNVFAFSS